MDPVRIYDYLVKSRDRVFDAVRSITPEQYRRELPFGLRSVGSTLTHIMISEWYYVERLKGREVPPYDRWPIKYESPPEFGAVERTWREQAEGVRAAIASERDWNRPITWLSLPDEQGRRFHIAAAAGDLLSQLALHEVHHRAQIMAMLRELGRPLEDLDYNALMFERKDAT